MGGRLPSANSLRRPESGVAGKKKTKNEKKQHLVPICRKELQLIILFFLLMSQLDYWICCVMLLGISLVLLHIAYLPWVLAKMLRMSDQLWCFISSDLSIFF